MLTQKSLLEYLFVVVRLINISNVNNGRHVPITMSYGRFFYYFKLNMFKLCYLENVKTLLRHIDQFCKLTY
jgi:hypothetical protein